MATIINLCDSSNVHTLSISVWQSWLWY